MLPLEHWVAFVLLIILAVPVGSQMSLLAELFRYIGSSLVRRLTQPTLKLRQPPYLALCHQRTPTRMLRFASCRPRRAILNLGSQVGQLYSASGPLLCSLRFAVSLSTQSTSNLNQGSGVPCNFELSPGMS